MDSIRKKMQSLKYETDELEKSIHDNEEVTKEANDSSDRCDCDIRDFGKYLLNRILTVIREAIL